MDLRPIRRALLSVSDKSGLLDLARALAGHKVELISTGGTRQALADAVSRWLLVRSESPDIDALKFVCQVKANIAQPERLL